LTNPISQINALADKLVKDFPGTYYAEIGKGIKRNLAILKNQKNIKALVESQRELAHELRETQALIQLSLDQSRPMTPEQVQEYLGLSKNRLERLKKSNRFPRTYQIDIDGETYPYYRKHEIDHFLYRRQFTPKRNPTEAVTSAATRLEMVRSGVNQLKR
jgi:hypothetical protein